MNYEDSCVSAKAQKYFSSCEEYTDPSEQDALVKDWKKKKKAAIAAVEDIRQRAGEIKGKKLLDLGFGNGTYAAAFAKAGAETSGLEVNSVLLDIAQDTLREEGVSADLRVYDGGVFPFQDQTFDYAFSVSVLEHVSDAQLFLKEADRVLKPGGKFYLAFPNRWRPIEAHAHILFIGYIPRLWAQFILRRFFHRNTIEELNLHYRSFWSMKRFLRGTSLRIVPEYKGKGLRGAIKRILWVFGVHHSAILGTVMVILQKEK